MFSIRQLAMFTGLTTRTLRNYLAQGILQGEKQHGAWCFSDEQLEQFFQNTEVRQLLHTKKLALVYDFLALRRKTVTELCIILDQRLSPEEADDASAFFCGELNRLPEGSRVQFAYEREADCARFILTGPETAVQPLLSAWYARS